MAYFLKIGPYDSDKIYYRLEINSLTEQNFIMLKDWDDEKEINSEYDVMKLGDFIPYDCRKYFTGKSEGTKITEEEFNQVKKKIFEKFLPQ
ncbi:hypothetical protein [Xanthovirga aplysinae]|uniref:hypothetical protein n=1 Tax=Xanthovirga aplysinae TaxID=2529853 RepID=UPI0012BCCDD4|nr:hypothetical protein [Xanthovirga aplysinae]MTI29522.1 hypothetical protein [Xanthovirga aplysinae]